MHSKKRLRLATSYLIYLFYKMFLSRVNNLSCYQNFFWLPTSLNNFTFYKIHVGCNLVGLRVEFETKVNDKSAYLVVLSNPFGIWLTCVMIETRHWSGKFWLYIDYSTLHVTENNPLGCTFNLPKIDWHVLATSDGGLVYTHPVILSSDWWLDDFDILLYFHCSTSPSKFLVQIYNLSSKAYTEYRINSF